MQQIFHILFIIIHYLSFQGRVDCIRSASTEALDWAKAACRGIDSDGDVEEEQRKVS